MLGVQLGNAILYVSGQTENELHICGISFQTRNAVKWLNQCVPNSGNEKAPTPLQGDFISYFSAKSAFQIKWR